MPRKRFGYLPMSMNVSGEVPAVTILHNKIYSIPSLNKQTNKIKKHKKKMLVSATWMTSKTKKGENLRPEWHRKGWWCWGVWWCWGWKSPWTTDCCDRQHWCRCRCWCWAFSCRFLWRQLERRIADGLLATPPRMTPCRALVPVRNRQSIGFGSDRLQQQHPSSLSSSSCSCCCLLCYTCSTKFYTVTCVFYFTYYTSSI